MGYKKIEQEIFRFEKKGDSLEGAYLGFEKGTLFDNNVYKLKTSEGKNIVFFGSVILNSLMSKITEGTKIKIVLTGFKENKKKGQNPTMLFDVYEWE